MILRSSSLSIAQNIGNICAMMVKLDKYLSSWVVQRSQVCRLSLAVIKGVIQQPFPSLLQPESDYTVSVKDLGLLAGKMSVNSSNARLIHSIGPSSVDQPWTQGFRVSKRRFPQDSESTVIIILAAHPDPFHPG